MELVKYNEACRAIAEAKSIDEVKTITNKAEAIRAYAKQAKNRQLEIDAAEIRIRAERKLGEILQKQEKNPGSRPSKKDGGTMMEPPSNIPTLKDHGIDKKLSSRAQKIAAVPEEEFEEMITDWRGKVETENERVTTNLIKRGEMEKKNEERKNKILVMPPDVFDVVYADPPWQYENSGFEMSAEKQYPTMPVDDIINISFKSNENAILFLWVTNPLLKEGLKVMEGWGFEYKTNMVWVKERHTAGFYVFGQHELLLIGIKGSKLPIEKKKSVFTGPNNKHSKKPDHVYETIETMYPNSKYLEIFARENRPGWKSYGNDI